MLPIFLVIHIYKPSIEESTQNVLTGTICENLIEVQKESSDCINHSYDTKVELRESKSVENKSNSDIDSGDENKSVEGLDFGVNGSAGNE
jgi:hypothetical protein